MIAPVPPPELEEWADVVGYEGVYVVSNYGRVKRILQKPGATKGRILRPNTDKDGYWTYCLQHNLRRRIARAHVLVLESFYGPAPEGKPWGLHNDGDNQNNHLSNLRWGDAQENQMDAIAHGTHKGSAKTSCLRGHPLDEGNTYYDRKGKRSCKECRVQAVRAHYKRARATGLPKGDPRHGTEGGYVRYGCKCDDCRRVGLEAKYRRRKGGVSCDTTETEG